MPMSSRSPRKKGDDLLTDLFEATADLGFLREALEGAELVVNLLFEGLPSRAVLVSFFDINAREFVVVRQAHPAQDVATRPSVVLGRVSEFADIPAAAMRSARTIVLGADKASALSADPRWSALGIVPTYYACAPVVSAGRYLGLIELADPIDGAPLQEGDGHALTYVGEQLAEYLAQREITFDEATVTKPKLTQLARR
jgi:GAF domain-containing protein